MEDTATLTGNRRPLFRGWPEAWVLSQPCRSTFSVLSLTPSALYGSTLGPDGEAPVQAPSSGSPLSQEPPASILSSHPFPGPAESRLLPELYKQESFSLSLNT